MSNQEKANTTEVVTEEKKEAIVIGNGIEMKTKPHFGDIIKADKLAKKNGVSMNKDEDQIQFQMYLIYVLCGSPKDYKPEQLMDEISLTDINYISKQIGETMGNIKGTQ